MSGTCHFFRTPPTPPSLNGVGGFALSPFIVRNQLCRQRPATSRPEQQAAATPVTCPPGLDPRPRWTGVTTGAFGRAGLRRFPTPPHAATLRTALLHRETWLAHRNLCCGCDTCEVREVRARGAPLHSAPTASLTTAIPRAACALSSRFSTAGSRATTKPKLTPPSLPIVAWCSLCACTSRLA